MTTNLTEHFQKGVQGINVPNNQTGHIPNSTQQYNVTTNRTEHSQKSTRDTKVPNNHTEHIQNSAQALT